MNRNRTVSLCLIVKDEATFLARALASFKEVVNEICVLDTGSSDETVAIAKSFGAKVKFFPWNDNFSEARNQNIEMATMNWIMVVNADEYLRREDIPALKQAFMRNDCDGFAIKLFNFSREGTPYYITHLSQRIFKNNGKFHYEGIIYEQLVGIQAPAKFESIDVSFYHTGHLRKERTLKNKNKRNLTLLKKALDEEGLSMFNLFNLANEISHDPERRQETLELYQQLYDEENFDTDFAPKLIMFRLLTLIREELWDEALEAIEEGLILFPDFTDLVYQRGIIQRKKGLLLKAIHSFKMCLSMGKPRSELEFSNASYAYGPMFHLAELMKEQQYFSEAFDYYQECWLLDHMKYQLLSPIFDCLVGMKIARGEVVLTMKRFFNLRNDLNRVSYVNLLLEKEFYEEATDFLTTDGTWQAKEKQRQLVEKALAGLNGIDAIES